MRWEKVKNSWYYVTDDFDEVRATVVELSAGVFGYNLKSFISLEGAKKAAEKDYSIKEHLQNGGTATTVERLFDSESTIN